MENTNAVSIPLVDVLSELTGERVVMNGDDYVFFETLEKVSQNEVDAAVALKEQKENYKDEICELMSLKIYYPKSDYLGKSRIFEYFENEGNIKIVPLDIETEIFK